MPITLGIFDFTTFEKHQPEAMKKIFLFILCLCIVGPLWAQKQKRKTPSTFNKQAKKDNDAFLEKQWWLGFKAGTNVTNVNVDKTYSVISAANYEPGEKEYESFEEFGFQATLEITFYYKGFNFSFQPTYQHALFSYSNSLSWSSIENATDRVDATFDQQHQVDHLILPLVVKYEVTGNTFRPYVQAGIYQALLLNANKDLERTEIDYASGGITTFEYDPTVVGADDLFAKWHWGVLGGIGCYYNVGNVRLNFDVIYKYGMSNISSVENRYVNDRLSGVGDALDDLTMDNISASLGVMFPLRFLGTGFKSLDRK